MVKVWLTSVTPPTVTVKASEVKPEPKAWVSSRPRIRWPDMVEPLRVKVSELIYSCEPAVWVGL